MTQAVIHILESIQVEKQQCETFAATMRGFNHIFEMLVEIDAAGEPGQLVGIGQLTNLSFGFALQGYVLHGTQNNFA